MANVASLRVLRVYHAGRDPAHRARERALLVAGAEVTLVVPRQWPEGSEETLPPEQFGIVELDVVRAGDVNRHRYRDARDLAEVIGSVRPDVLDLHEEPFSVAVRQWCRAAPPELPIVTYTAQNVDKRLPPPFHQYERSAHRRAAGMYPCSCQAASVARGKSFTGRIAVLPLGHDPELFWPGGQAAGDDEVVLALVGRLVPEKGVEDAVRILAAVHSIRPTRLVLCGGGPEIDSARELASSLGVGGRLELAGRLEGQELAALYRRTHVVLVPSRATSTWTEQFGRVIDEAQASGALVAGYASGSIPEVGGEAVVLAEVGNVDRLAARVLEVLRDPAEWKRRRSVGFELAAERTWERVAESQVAFYRAVLDHTARCQLPVSPRRRRAVARAEFGPTAPTTAGLRPFALPILRRGGPLADALAAVCDAGAEAVALVQR